MPGRNRRIVAGAHRDLRAGEALILPVGLHELPKRVQVELLEVASLAQPNEVLSNRVRLPRRRAVRNVREEEVIQRQISADLGGALGDFLDLAGDDLAALT